MEIKKKKRVLLVDGASDWLQIWTAGSSLDVKGNKAIKKNAFIANRLVFPNTVTYIILVNFYQKLVKLGTYQINSNKHFES